ncbi:MAG: hypothetical protein C4523_21505 [Myxococcales bacterium]|nr:MAG: hypothetical protein C4523_21505 [Myxococcales bacterium]
MKNLTIWIGAVAIFSMFVALGCGQGGGQAAGGSHSCPPSGSGAPWTQSSGSGDVVASINGVNIYLSDYKERMEKQSPYIRARYGSLDKKKEFLDNIIRFELLAQEAIKKGYDKDPEVIQSAKQVMTQKLMRTEFEDTAKRDDIPEAELQKYYDEHKDEYQKPAMRRASHILLKVAEGAPAADWAKVEKKARQILREAQEKKTNPNGFRTLAQQYSDDDATKGRGGDLGYFSSSEEGGPMDKALSSAVFALDNVNDIGGPIKTPLGYHIVRLTGKRDAINRTFEQVRGQIQHRIYKDTRTQNYEQFLENLRKNAAITVNENVLNGYEVPGSKGEGEGAPSAPPASADPNAPPPAAPTPDPQNAPPEEGRP